MSPYETESLEEYVNRRYFNWLCDNSGLYSVDLVDGKTYSFLANILYNTQYSYIIPNDKNRMQDGKDLADSFIVECNGIREWHDILTSRPPSILAVLYALAIRWEDNIMYDYRYGNRSHVWFMEMLDNLGLLQYDDAHCTEETEYIIARVLERFIYRVFDPAGNGSPFPIKNPTRDQREIELWLQLNDYIYDKYSL